MTIRMKVKLKFKIKRYGPTFENRLKSEISQKTTLVGVCLQPVFEERARIELKRWALLALDFESRIKKLRNWFSNVIRV